MKYAIVFSLLATVLVVNTCWAESWWAIILLGWVGASMGLVAAAYWLNTPGVFGKRPDGRVAWLNRLALLPYGLLIQSWLKDARCPVEVLPCAREDGDRAVLAAQVTTRSPMRASQPKLAGRQSHIGSSLGRYKPT